MSTELMERPTETVNPTNIIHVMCRCDLRSALCGMEVLGIPINEFPNCAVCVDLWGSSRCPKCGGQV